MIWVFRFVLDQIIQICQNQKVGFLQGHSAAEFQQAAGLSISNDYFFGYINLKSRTFKSFKMIWRHQKIVEVQTTYSISLRSHEFWLWLSLTLFRGFMVFQLFRFYNSWLEFWKWARIWPLSLFQTKFHFIT